MLRRTGQVSAAWASSRRSACVSPAALAGMVIVTASRQHGRPYFQAALASVSELPEPPHCPPVAPKMVGAAGTDGPALTWRWDTRDPCKIAGFASQSPDPREGKATRNDLASGNRWETSLTSC